MKAIVCVDKNWGIGNADSLLFHIPEDMAFFKRKTIGNVVVMGLATFLSLPGQKPLADRVNIVLSNKEDWSAPGVIVCHSIDELFELLKSCLSLRRCVGLRAAAALLRHRLCHQGGRFKAGR